MIRRFAEHRLAKPAARERQPAGNRVVRFIVLSLGAGAIAALLALTIAIVPALMVLAFPTDTPQILATSLFPTPSPTVKVISVYDPPPPAPRPPVSRQSPEPAQSPEPGDGGGGGVDN